MITKNNLNIIRDFCQYLGMHQEYYKLDINPSPDNIDFIRKIVKICQWGFALKNLEHNNLDRNRAIFEVSSKSKALRVMLATRAITTFDDKLVIKFKANDEIWVELV